MATHARHIVRLFIAISTILATPGCAGHAKPAEAARATVSDAVTGVAGVVAHTESAQRHVEQAIPHTDDTGKVHLAAATDEHKEVVADAAETKQALDATAKEITALEGQVVAVRANYTKLESRWYVRWGRWIERVLWIIGISWLICGVASIVLGLGNPLSLTWRMGKEITPLVSLMNVFSWVRDWLLSGRAASATGKAG